MFSLSLKCCEKRETQTGWEGFYVHGRNSDGAWEIRRAVSNGRTELDDQAFEVVIDASIFGHDKSRNVQGVFSPSIIYWSQ